MSEYDVAVSFAEEQRSAVEEVVRAFQERGLTVLHGPEQTHEWWAHKEGGDLPDARVRFFIPFVSGVDDFTTAALRAVKAGDEHVLPVLLGDVTVPSDLLHPHVAYVRGTRPDQLADAVVGRIEAAEAVGSTGALVTDVVARVKGAVPVHEEPVVPATFSRYAEQDATLRFLGEQFAAALPRLQRRGFVGTAHVGDARIAVRVERAGDTVYALDIQRGGIGGDETVNFVVGKQEGQALTNGWARPVYDTAAGAAVLEVHDFSVLGGGGAPRSYRREDLFTALWERIDAVLTSTVA
ncbi:toll/interleukin-1 receptor domain-containing protein [Saccharothrix sp. S26]|uniref:toll/interleukin-1 receptor domain-containing protein n=1 Tax=Saccharothrix sp. S26 TaxID=2907215 RepID=UPI001F343DF7|nr:toll/interleukin-1 receptor domain-containing protein [Saccharothrix sp. S26]MCE6993309.1 toll/interleukin-1 receptor domain-containing protein [Saccharothrix sp. S26]